MRIRVTVLTVALLGLVAALPATAARGGRHGGFGGHHRMTASGFSGGTRGSGAFAGDQRHANDDYVKAASQEEDKLDTKIRSICRGC